MTSIRNIQRQLATMYGPGNYYTIAYRHQELTYSGDIHKWITVQRPASVLDVGPGYGALAAYCSQFAQVETLDMVPFISDYILAYFGIRASVGNIEKDWQPSCPGRKYDAIILTEVLEHFNFHPVPTLRRLKSLLQPSGKLYLSTPNAATWGRVHLYDELTSIPVYNPQIELPWVDAHIWQYNRSELMSVLTDAGFSVSREATSVSSGGSHFVIEAQ